MPTFEVEFVILYGNAGPDDDHLAATVHCVDGEIVAWLEQRERRRKRDAQEAARQSVPHV
jgi:hypothetical protein